MSKYSFLSSPPSPSQSARSLFALPNKEYLYERFSCTLWNKILIPGSLFCFENYLCFYGKLFASKNKIVISLVDMQEIRKGKSFGHLSNSIEILTKSGETFHFTGFSDRENTYQLIQALHKNVVLGEDKDTGSDTSIESNNSIIDEEEESRQSPDSDGKLIVYETVKESNPAELIKVGFPVPIEKVFELFFSDEAKFSLLHLMEEREATELNITKWRNNPDGENKFIRDMAYVVKVKGIPFKSKTRVQAVHQYEKESDTITLNIVKKSLDVPYSDSFQIEEKWSLSNEQESPNRCILITTVNVNFSKSVSVEKLIKSKTVESLKLEHETWLQKIQALNCFAEKKKTRKIHAKEKSKEGEIEEEKPELESESDSDVFLQQKIVEKNTAGTLKVEKLTYFKGKNPQFFLIILLLIVIILLLSLIGVMYSKIQGLEARISSVENPLNRLVETEDPKWMDEWLRM